jgi:hypothetical protein
VNITYIVHKLPQDPDASVRDYFGWLSSLIIKRRETLPKTPVFFHRVSKQALAYEYLDDELTGEKGHYGGPPYSDRNHLFEMYHMKTDDSVKMNILETYSETDGKMRCVFASSSFSMGLNIKDIKYVIHFGPAMDLDDFIQETGRAGRMEGEQAISILLLFPRCLNGSNITPSMKDYVRTKQCRRKALLKEYNADIAPIEPLHLCCDNCGKVCMCGDCPPSPLYDLGILEDEEDEEEEDVESDIDVMMSGSDSEGDSDIEIAKRKPQLILSEEEDNIDE